MNNLITILIGAPIILIPLFLLFKNIKKEVKGEGCAGCTGNCSSCHINDIDREKGCWYLISTAFLGVYWSLESVILLTSKILRLSSAFFS